jgi:Secretion system C-terminal sorting domain
VVNNTSANQGTTRAFSWDIIGDHTGIGNTSAANAPTPAGSVGGYMLLVNAAYSPSIIYQSTVTGLFPNSTYTFEFWIWNVSPGASKVLPSLTVSVGGIDIFSSGQVDYGTAWYKRTFTFLSTAGGTATISMRNNSPGGSGNDWALDDVSLRQCLILLPPSITEFRGQKADAGVILDWKAGQEDDVKEYVIQYSEDGKNFTDAGTVASTQKGGDYSFTHQRSTSVEKMYYRLKIVDKNNRISYTGVILIRGTVSSSVMRVTPNPSTSVPTFQMVSSRAQLVNLTVRDASGREVNRFSQQLSKGSNTFRMTGTSLKPGMYFVTAVQADGSLLSERFIVTQ